MKSAEVESAQSEKMRKWSLSSCIRSFCQLASVFDGQHEIHNSYPLCWIMGGSQLQPSHTLSSLLLHRVYTIIYKYACSEVQVTIYSLHSSSYTGAAQSTKRVLDLSKLAT